MFSGKSEFQPYCSMVIYVLYEAVHGIIYIYATDISTDFVFNSTWDTSANVPGL
jgi:hypothetical protein